MASPSVKQTGPSDSVNSVITRDGLYPHVLGYAGKEAEKGRRRVDSRGAEVEELKRADEACVASSVRRCWCRCRRDAKRCRGRGDVVGAKRGDHEKLVQDSRLLSFGFVHFKEWTTKFTEL
jgi:hypothetical protein